MSVWLIVAQVVATIVIVVAIGIVISLWRHEDHE